MILLVQNYYNIKFYQLKFEGYFTVNPFATEQLAILLNNNSIVFWSSSDSKRKYESTIIKGVNQQGISLSGVNIDNSNGLSEKNILIFNQEGDYKGFNQNEIRELLLKDQKQTIENVTFFDFKSRGFNSESANIIARNSEKWINLKKLNLSRNNFLDADAEKIAENAVWPNLEELILSSNQISNKAVTAIASNTTGRKLRKLCLNSIILALLVV